METKVEDGTQTDVIDATKDTSTVDVKPSALDDDPKYKAAVKAQESLSGLLEDHGFDSLENLVEELKSSADLKGKIGENDLDKILKNSNTLEKYEEYWASQKEQGKRETEDSDDTVKRLDKEIKELKSNREKESQQSQQLEESVKAVKFFDDEVTSLVEKSEISEEHRPFLSEFLGVNNPSNEIDITNKVAVKRMVKDGLGKFDEFIKSIQKQSVEDYLAGKLKIPSMSSTENAAPEAGKTEIKNLKDARKGALESLTRHFMGAK